MLVNVLLIGSILTIAAYLGWISYLILGQSPIIHHSHQKPKSISIIICCRNDQKELIHLTNAIQQQILPHQQVELIVVDDHSDEPIEMPNNRFNQLLTLSASDGEGKKAALAKGIAHAKNEWIVTLDADVLISSRWLDTIISSLDFTSDLCILPIGIKKQRGALPFFQWMEFYMLQLITRGSAHRGTALLCNGAHLAFEKKAWQEDYWPQINWNVASGDDQFLLEAFRIRNKKIVFLDNLIGTVNTTPVLSWKDLFSQRRRWSAKANGYQIWDMQALGWITLLANLCWILLILLLLFKWIHPVFWIVWATYLLVEYTWMKRLTKEHPFSTLLFLLFYPLYVIITLASFLISPTEWKGRTIKA